MTPGFEDHFSHDSGRYREFRPGYPRELFEFLVSVAPGCELAWDCATGNGQAAAALSDFFQTVIATDASENQVANAEIREGITYRVEAAESTSIGQGLVDLVVVAQAVHWFNTGLFGQEAHRVLKQGGILAVWSYGLCRVSPEIDEIIYKLYEHTLGSYWPPERKLVENRYQDIIFDMPELSVPDFSMKTQWDADQLAGYLNTWSAVRQYMEAGNPNPVEKSWLREAWGDRRLTVEWPLVLKVWQKPC